MPASTEPGTTFLYESWRARLVFACLPILVMAGLVAGSEGTIRVLAIAALVVLLLDELVRLGRPVAKLTPTMIVVTTLRQQEVAWHRIAGITTSTKFGTHRIVLEIDNGERVTLAGPTANFLARRHFDACIEQIRREWQQHRGANRPAAPQPDAQ